MAKGNEFMEDSMSCLLDHVWFGVFRFPLCLVLAENCS